MVFLFLRLMLYIILWSRKVQKRNFWFWFVEYGIFVVVVVVVVKSIENDPGILMQIRFGVQMDQ